MKGRLVGGGTLAAVLVAVLVVLYSLRGDDARFGAVFSAAAVGFSLVAIGCFIFLARQAGRSRFWVLLAAGLVVIDVAGSTLSLDSVFGVDAALGIALSLRILAMGLIVMGIARVPTTRVGAVRGGGGLLDFMTVAAGSAGLIWYAVVGRVVSGDGFAPILASLVPVVHVIACYAALATRLRGPDRAFSGSLTWLVVACALMAMYDSYGAAVVASGRELPATTLWVFAPLLASLAAFAMAGVCGVADRRRQGVERPFGHGAWSLAVPVGSLLAVQLLLIVAVGRTFDPYPWAGLVAASAVTTTSVGIRQAMALRENRRLVGTDALTGLPNRRRLTGHLDSRVSWAAADRPTVVLLCDLDAFKQVNDAYGHETGDRVLRAFAAVLARACGPGDLPARLGGDEFAVVMAADATEEDGVRLARRVLAECAGPIPVGGNLVRPRVSIGIAVGGAGVDADDLLRRADEAMYEAKRHRGESWHVYAGGPARDDSTAGLLDDFERALRSDGLHLVYQPVVDMRSGGTLLGVEALLRWQHPTRGLLSPVVFVPLAEQAGLAQELGEWVLEHACRQVVLWQAAHPGHPIDLAVNLSPSQLDHASLVDTVDAILARTGMDPKRLVLEITESALVDDLRSVPVLEALRARGIRIALDDFGTGYSSLRYLTRLPVDMLKLDRCFVADLADDAGAGRPGAGAGAAVADAVSRLAGALGFDTVAEGIEDEQQADRLRAMGYRVAQGFHYAVPLPPEAIDDLMSAARVPVPAPRAPLSPVTTG